MKNSSAETYANDQKHSYNRKILQISILGCRGGSNFETPCTAVRIFIYFEGSGGLPG